MTKNDSLHDLILRIENGDPSAFDALFKQMCEPLCNQVLGKYGPTLSKEDAEDAVQIAFIIIKLKAHTYHGEREESARAWIRTIVFHEASKMVEANKRLSTSIDDLDGTGIAGQDKYAVPERSSYTSNLYREGNRPLEESVDQAILLSAIRAGAHQWLSTDEMNILSMRFDLEYTFEEIGRKIGKTKVRAKQIIDALIERIRSFAGVNRTPGDGG